MSPGRPAEGTGPEVEITELRIPGRSGVVPARSYGASDRVLVWAHGGGFLHGDLDMPESDEVGRQLARAGIRVISVGYRLIGPGVTFPAPSDDLVDAIEWATTRAGARQLFVGGASAGANLVTGALMRRPRRVLPVRRLLLAYPTLHARQPAPDGMLRALLARTPEPDVFGPENLRRMYEAYLGGDPADAPSFAIPGEAAPAELAALPPTTIIAAELDELRVSAELFAARLQASGGVADLRLVPGAAHGFLDVPGDPAAGNVIGMMAAQILETT